MGWRPWAVTNTLQAPVSSSLKWESDASFLAPCGDTMRTREKHILQADSWLCQKRHYCPCCPTPLLSVGYFFVLFCSFVLFCFFVFLPFHEPLPWHMEVPRLGVKSEL